MKPAPIITQIRKENMLRGNIERADRNIIQSIIAQLENEKCIFSLNNLSSRLVCIFRELQFIRFDTLKKIYLLSDKIKVIKVTLRSKSLQVQIFKSENDRERVLIKKRPNMSEIEACANKFITKMKIHKSDSRLCLEIVKLLYKWTWGKAACKVEMKLYGDTYDCKISNLQDVTFQQLQLLSKLSDLITEIQVNFNSKLLTFKVTRTNEYITLNEINNNKKRKL